MNKLIVSGCDSLTYLYCNNSMLSELDASNLSKLTRLSCYSNANMNVIKVYGCNELTFLYCYGNDLKELDVSNLSKLQSLLCDDNPFQSLKLPGQDELKITVSPVNSGKVMFSKAGNFLHNKKFTLTAVAENGCSFICWTGGTDDKNPVNSFTLSGSMSVTANFTPPITYALEIQADTGGQMIQGTDGNYVADTKIPLKAKADTGYVFAGWTSSNGGSFVDEDSAETTFIMPGNPTTITAHFKPELTVPGITGDVSMNVAYGYAATSSRTFTLTGNPLPAVTSDEDYGGRITWNGTTNKLDIASGLGVGTYPVVLTAGNGVAPDASLTFTLTVEGEAPVITGPTEATLTQGYAATSTGVFTFTGNPTPTVEKTSGNAAITWNGTERKLEIAAGLPVGVYPVTLTASNGIQPDAAITFTLTVDGEASALTGPTSMTLIQGYPAACTGAFTLTGNPEPSVTMDDTHGGKITWNSADKKLEIAQGLAAGVYPVTLTASNGVEADAALTFTLTVLAPPTHEIIDGGRIEVKPGEDYSVTFKGDFKSWKSIRLNGVEMKIVPQSGTRSDLTYPGYPGNAGRGRRRKREDHTL